VKGSYILFLYSDRDMHICIGKLGCFGFKRGFYAYIGSAKNSLYGRINYHYKTNKKGHWHIDYLIEKSRIVGFVAISSASEECLYKLFSKYYRQPIKGFGSSDAKHFSHLFFLGKTKQAIDNIFKYFYTK